MVARGGRRDQIPAKSLVCSVLIGVSRSSSRRWNSLALSRWILYAPRQLLVYSWLTLSSLRISFSQRKVIGAHPRLGSTDYFADASLAAPRLRKLRSPSNASFSS